MSPVGVASGGWAGWAGAVTARDASAVSPMELRSYGQLDSTLLEARRLRESGVAMPFAVMAETQRLSPGRRGERVGMLPGSVGLTVAWPARARAAEHSEAVMLLAGVAAAESIEHEAGGVRVRVGWPGELHAAATGRGLERVGSVLVEVQAGRTCGSAVGCVLVDVRVNVGLSGGLAEVLGASDAGRTTMESAARRAASGVGPTLVERMGRGLVAHLAEALLALDSGGLGLTARGRIESRLLWRGEVVGVSLGDTRITGRLIGVDEAGRLIVDVPDLGERRLNGADVRWVGPVPSVVIRAGAMVRPD